MPSFRRRASVIDADRVDEPTREADQSPKAERLRALAEEAEAEAAEAEATAAAARARARALRLRREADAAGPQAAETTPAVDADVDDIAPAELEDAEPTPIELDEATAAELDEADSEPDAQPGQRRPRLPRPTWKGITATLAVVLIAGLLARVATCTGTTGRPNTHRQLNAEYYAAARQSVVTLMSLDFTKAKEDVQRIIDNSTGQFKDRLRDAGQRISSRWPRIPR